MADYTIDTSAANRQYGRRRTRAARTVASVPARTARSVTQRSGIYSGKGLLTGELLVGFVIIAIRVVGNYEIQEGGAVKGKVLTPQGQYGPVAVLAGLIGSFFLLSFVAMGGGVRAKLAVILGGIIILTLGVNTYRSGDITKISNTFGNIGKIQVPAASGTLPDIFGSGSTAAANIDTSAQGAQGTIENIFNQLPNAPKVNPGPPAGWTAVPNTNNSEVYARNGKCPPGYTLAGDRCILPVQTGNPAT